ncbi:helix-turn-helix domain-containing protein [Psychrobacter sp. I-STPA6b]|uniref:helix-turn-helix domain-containing protein n=1 Tax=Psychrobacter sp. I-STPA6b TaxID=2585718 RepID=UPI001D0CC2AD|nr:helix-turn-helix transcriptional regulator [Psychrobacter sp. I-STPA6b]
MSNLRKSIHSAEHELLRYYLKSRREELGLSQRALGTRMGVIYSFIGKVETGDRRLDVIEFIEYCKALDLDAIDVIKLIQDSKNDDDKL